MIDLPLSGLPIQLNPESGILQFDSIMNPVQPAIRNILDALPYYENQASPKDNFPIYFMYRNVKRNIDDKMVEDSVYRYDITVILPGKFGQEFFKTIGHVHPKSKQTNLSYTYTEVYSVIYGTAHYIIQQYSHDLEKILDVVDLEVKAGEHVLIPSFYGHVTVNITKEPLVMANILYRDFDSLYAPYLQKRGAAIYIKDDKMKEPIYSINPNYDLKVKPRKAYAKEFYAPKLKQMNSLYNQWIQNLDDFNYLYEPILGGK